MIAAALAIAVGVALALAPSSGRAAAPDTVFLEELTWTELRDEIRAGKTTVIVPVGGTEQSGPHMALGKHNARVKALPGRIAREPRQRAGGAGDRLRARRRHRSAGRPHALCRNDQHSRRSVRDGCWNTPRAAFARTGSATSCSSAITAATRRAAQQESPPSSNREWAATPVRVHALEEYYRAADRGFAAMLRKRRASDAEIGSHAGAADTSLIARRRRAARARRRLPDGGALGAAEGVSGDPRRASAELGRPASTPSSRARARRSSAMSRATERRDPSSVGTQRDR